MTKTFNPTMSPLKRIDALPDFLKDKFAMWQETHSNHAPEDVHQMIDLMETANQAVNVQLVTGLSFDQIFRHVNHHCPTAENLDERHLAGAYNMAVLYAQTCKPQPVVQKPTKVSPMQVLLLTLSRGRGS